VSPPADPAAEPQGFVVQADDETRLHFLDWGGPPPGVLLIHGLAQTAWTWTPVARQLRAATRVIAMDLRGHGLSEAPTAGWDADTLAADAIAVAEGTGLLDAPSPVLAGHGFGAIVAAWAAAALGDRVAGLVLVDGGWEDVAEATDQDPEEFLRGLDEPPEVLRSMDAFLADRRDFDPATWDADQEQAARATVVETHAGRLTPATRPHAVAGAVAAMFDYDPRVVLPSIACPIVALRAVDDEDGTHARSLAAAQRALHDAGRPPIRVATFPDAGHNLMRYRPGEVTAAILSLTRTL
jgi:pimeloyl-ACP methyl ester carboxylesterase